MSGRELRVDQDTCIGSGNCVRVAPSVFDQDDEGLVIVLPDVDPEAAAEDVDLAAAGCPVGAIEFE